MEYKHDFYMHCKIKNIGIVTLLQCSGIELTTAPGYNCTWDKSGLIFISAQGRKGNRKMIAYGTQLKPKDGLQIIKAAPQDPYIISYMQEPAI